MFENKYPYTDFHELNLDWVLERTKELQAKVNELIEKYKNVDELVERANQYTDAEIAKVKTDVAKNTSDLIALSNRLSTDIDTLTKYVDKNVEDINVTMDSRYTRVQQMITQQWEDIKAYISEQVFDVKVRNFFTGQLVSLQSMFDYLAQLHLTDSGTYAQVSNINTYNHYIAKNETYTNVILASRTFFNS